MASLVSMSPPPKGPHKQQKPKVRARPTNDFIIVRGDGGGVGGTHPHKAAAAKVELSNGPFVQRKPRVQV